MDQQQIEETRDSEDPKFPVRIRKYTRRMACKLSDKDVVSRARHMAQLGRQIGELEDALKSHVDVAKAEIKKLEAEKSQIETEIDHGETMRDVACQSRMIFRLGEVQDVRLDTGEVFNTRPFTAEENQPELPLNGSGGSDADEEDDDSDDEESGNDEGEPAPDPEPTLSTSKGRGRGKR